MLGVELAADAYLERLQTEIGRVYGTDQDPVILFLLQPSGFYFVFQCIGALNQFPEEPASPMKPHLGGAFICHRVDKLLHDFRYFQNVSREKYDLKCDQRGADQQGENPFHNK